MSDGFQFMDIIFFGMVAAFLVLRLYSVLGKRTGHERPPGEVAAPPVRRDAERGNVVDLPGRRSPLDGDLDQIVMSSHPAGAGITQIRLADPNFSPDFFVDGAKAAFAMILQAYVRGDEKALRPLLADEVYGNFVHAIAERRRTGEQLETELVNIKSAEIVDAGMQGRTARVTVKFVSDQVIVVRDAADQVIEGDANRVTKVTDLWTFARDTRSSDPNWLLVETRSPEE